MLKKNPAIEIAEFTRTKKNPAILIAFDLKFGCGEAPVIRIRGQTTKTKSAYAD